MGSSATVKKVSEPGRKGLSRSLEVTVHLCGETLLEVAGLKVGPDR